MKYDDVLFCENTVEVASQLLALDVVLKKSEAKLSIFSSWLSDSLYVFPMPGGTQSVLIWLYSIALLKNYSQTNQSIRVNFSWDMFDSSSTMRDLPLLQEYFSYRHWWKLWLLPKCYICSYFMVCFYSSHYSLRLYKVFYPLSILLSASKSAIFSCSNFIFLYFSC